MCLLSMLYDPVNYMTLDVQTGHESPLIYMQFFSLCILYQTPIYAQTLATPDPNPLP